MIRSVAIILLIFCSLSLFSQEPEYLELVKAEARLQGLFNRLYTDSITEVEPLLDSIRGEIKEALSIPGSLDFPWSRLDKIGVVDSEDKRMRVVSWHVEDDRDHYRYFCYIQVGMKKGKIKLYELSDNGKPQRGMAKTIQTKSDWYGKLYYQVISKKYKRKTYYTLLGMDFNNALSTIKTVEVMQIQRNEPHFVRSHISRGVDFTDRLVLEYAKQVAISVRYDPGTGMITFDHLVPFHPIYENNFEFYGPDGSFDGLEFEGGLWIYRDDIDARNID
jgi:hypothetical protein